MPATGLVLFNPHNSSLRRMLRLSPRYRWGNRGLVPVNSPKVYSLWRAELGWDLSSGFKTTLLTITLYRELPCGRGSLPCSPPLPTSTQPLEETVSQRPHPSGRTWLSPRGAVVPERPSGITSIKGDTQVRGEKGLPLSLSSMWGPSSCADPQAPLRVLPSRQTAAPFILSDLAVYFRHGLTRCSGSIGLVLNNWIPVGNGLLQKGRTRADERAQQAGSTGEALCQQTGGCWALWLPAWPLAGPLLPCCGSQLLHL